MDPAQMQSLISLLATADTHTLSDALQGPNGDILKTILTQVHQQHLRQQQQQQSNPKPGGSSDNPQDSPSGDDDPLTISGVAIPKPSDATAQTLAPDPLLGASSLLSSSLDSNNVPPDFNFFQATGASPSWSYQPQPTRSGRRPQPPDAATLKDTLILEDYFRFPSEDEEGDPDFEPPLSSPQAQFDDGAFLLDRVDFENLRHEAGNPFISGDEGGGGEEGGGEGDAGDNGEGDNDGEDESEREGELMPCSPETKPTFAAREMALSDVDELPQGTVESERDAPQNPPSVSSPVSPSSFDASAPFPAYPSVTNTSEGITVTSPVTQHSSIPIPAVGVIATSLNKLNATHSTSISPNSLQPEFDPQVGSPSDVIPISQYSTNPRKRPREEEEEEEEGIGDLAPRSFRVPRRGSSPNPFNERQTSAHPPSVNTREPPWSGERDRRNDAAATAPKKAKTIRRESRSRSSEAGPSRSSSLAVPDDAASGREYERDDYRQSSRSPSGSRSPIGQTGPEQQPGAGPSSPLTLDTDDPSRTGQSLPSSGVTRERGGSGQGRGGRRPSAGSNLPSSADNINNNNNNTPLPDFNNPSSTAGAPATRRRIYPPSERRARKLERNKEYAREKRAVKKRDEVEMTARLKRLEEENGELRARNADLEEELERVVGGWNGVKDGIRQFGKSLYEVTGQNQNQNLNQVQSSSSGAEGQGIPPLGSGLKQMAKISELTKNLFEVLRQEIGEDESDVNSQHSQRGDGRDDNEDEEEEDEEDEDDQPWTEDTSRPTRSTYTYRPALPPPQPQPQPQPPAQTRTRSGRISNPPTHLNPVYISQSQSNSHSSRATTVVTTPRGQSAKTAAPAALATSKEPRTSSRREEDEEDNTPRARRDIVQAVSTAVPPDDDEIDELQTPAT